PIPSVPMAAAQPPPAPVSRPVEPVKAPTPEITHHEEAPAHVERTQKETVKNTSREKVDSSDGEAKPSSSKHQIKVNTTRIKKKNSSSKNNSGANNSNSDESAKARQYALSSAVNSAYKSMQSGLSASTTVALPTGTGGEAYAGYVSFVKTAYYSAWNVPED